MEFSGRVYFDVTSGDSWRFYQLIARAFEERVQIRLEWRSWVAGGLGDGPLTGQLRALAAYEWVREAVPTKQGPFLQALFIAVHEESAPPGDAAAIALAARLAGLDAERLPEAIQPWFGDSVGRFEGDTLVVETTNFHPEQSFRASLRHRVYIASDATVTERFTRASPKEILYEFSVDDPQHYTQVWKGEMPLLAAEGQIYEYACHEGNYALENILAGEREKD